jgi:FMN-dependent NADH-azoreductase
MPQVLLINASARHDTVGFRLANELADGLANAHAGRVVHRDLCVDPLSPLTAEYAGALTRRTPFDHPVFIQSERLIGEIEASDALVITTPMHNFTVPATLKLWIDYVVRIGRTFESRPDGKFGLLSDRPVHIVVSSSGIHREPDARQPDFLTDYLAHVLLTIGLSDTRFVYLQGLAQGPDAQRDAYERARLELARELSSAHRVAG